MAKVDGLTKEHSAQCIKHHGLMGCAGMWMFPAPVSPDKVTTLQRYWFTSAEEVAETLFEKGRIYTYSEVRDILESNLYSFFGKQWKYFTDHTMAEVKLTKQIMGKLMGVAI